MSVAGVIGAVVSRADSWVNALTGLGTIRDKLMHTAVVPGMRLGDGTLEALFNDDDLARKIVSKIPRDATRRGFRLALEGASDDDSAEVNREVFDRLTELRALPKLREGWIWARLYGGGGGVFVGADDGQDPALPLREDGIRSLKFLNVVRRPQLRMKKRNGDIRAPNYGEPELYEVLQTAPSGQMVVGSGILVHASRLILFPGTLTARSTPPNTLEQWDDSVLQCVHDAIRQAAVAWQSCAHLMTDASQGVLKIANLVDLIESGGKEALRTRIEMMDLARSVCRAILIDADREEFTRVATSFAGLPEMLDREMMRVAAAAEMPVTILFGRSPAGLNATGESDIRAWYDTVVDAQTDQLKPALERLLKLIFAAKDSPTSGEIPERWTIEFNPLWQPTEKEQAETLKLKADTHVALVTAGIELDSEGALALAKDIPTIDVEHRQQLMEADIAAGVRPGHYPEDQQQQQNDPNADDPLPEDA